MEPTATRPGQGEYEADEPRSVASLSFTDVRHRFGEVEVLAGIDLTVGPGEVVALVGPSGCGKSTLLELAGGLQEPAAGEIAAAGGRTAEARLQHCALMPQRDLLLPWLRAIDNATLGLRLAGERREQARARARPLFGRLGLAGFELARPGELSGGMRQRVAFARTLLTGKPILLLDEPFAALDAITRADLQEWLLEALATDSRTTLLVTHDVEEALFLADRVAVLSQRPGRAALELSSPHPRGSARAEVVTDPEFAAARERALLALGGGSGGSR